MAKILLIDDDAALRRFLQDALERRGHQVSCLERAEGGVDVLAFGEFDLVLVDEHLVGMPGSEFLKVLRKKRLGVPAILITGHAIGTLTQSMKEIGVHVVGKPFGGYDEFWKDLEPILDLALQGEAEIIESIRHAVAVALKTGKTDVLAYLRCLLYSELLTCVLAEVNDDTKKAKQILGVSPCDLLREKPPEPSLKTRALVLIADHPELTVDDIADQLGCSKATLYRNESIRAMLKQRKGGDYRGPSGYKTPDGDVEAYDD